MLGLFDQLGPAEILIVLAVFLLLFGAKKLPDLARSLGRSSTEFRKGLKEGEHDSGENEATPVANTAQPTAPAALPQASAPEPVSETKPQPEKAQQGPISE
jgi:sec-independent protein translocase protein TatA